MARTCRAQPSGARNCNLLAVSKLSLGVEQTAREQKSNLSLTSATTSTSAALGMLSAWRNALLARRGADADTELSLKPL